MNTKIALRKLTKNALNADGISSEQLSSRATDFLDRYNEREAAILAKKADEKIDYVSVIKAKNKIAAEASVVEDVPVAMTFFVHQAIKKVATKYQTDRGLMQAVSCLDALWRKDPTGSVTTKQLADIRTACKRAAPKSIVDRVIDTEVSRVGYNRLPVAKLARIAAKVKTQEDFDNLVKANGLTSDRSDHVQSRSLIMSLVAMRKTAEDDLDDQEGFAEQADITIAELRSSISDNTEIDTKSALATIEKALKKSDTTDENAMVSSVVSSLRGSDDELADELASVASSVGTGIGVGGDDTDVLDGEEQAFGLELEEGEELDPLEHQTSIPNNRPEYEKDTSSKPEFLDAIESDASAPTGAPGRMYGGPKSKIGLPPENEGILDETLKDPDSVYWYRKSDKDYHKPTTEERIAAKIAQFSDDEEESVDELGEATVPPDEALVIPEDEMSLATGDEEIDETLADEHDEEFGAPESDGLNSGQIDELSTLKDEIQQVVTDANLPGIEEYDAHEQSEGHHDATPLTDIVQWSAEETLMEDHASPTLTPGWIEEEKIEMGKKSNQEKSKPSKASKPTIITPKDDAANKALAGKPGSPVQHGRLKGKKKAVMNKASVEAAILDGHVVKFGSLSIHVNGNDEIEFWKKGEGLSCQLSDMDIAVTDFMKAASAELRRTIHPIIESRHLVPVPCSRCASIYEFDYTTDADDTYKCACGHNTLAPVVESLVKNASLKVQASIIIRREKNDEPEYFKNKMTEFAAEAEKISGVKFHTADENKAQFYAANNTADTELLKLVKTEFPTSTRGYARLADPVQHGKMEQDFKLNHEEEGSTAHETGEIQDGDMAGSPVFKHNPNEVTPQGERKNQYYVPHTAPQSDPALEVSDADILSSKTIEPPPAPTASQETWQCDKCKTTNAVPNKCWKCKGNRKASVRTAQTAYSSEGIPGSGDTAAPTGDDVAGPIGGDSVSYSKSEGADADEPTPEVIGRAIGYYKDKKLSVVEAIKTLAKDFSKSVDKWTGELDAMVVSSINQYYGSARTAEKMQAMVHARLAFKTPKVRKPTDHVSVGKKPLGAGNSDDEDPGKFKAKKPKASHGSPKGVPAKGLGDGNSDERDPGSFKAKKPAANGHVTPNSSGVKHVTDKKLGPDSDHNGKSIPVPAVR
jgi:hypothetical protein